MDLADEVAPAARPAGKAIPRRASGRVSGDDHGGLTGRDRFAAPPRRARASRPALSRPQEVTGRPPLDLTLPEGERRSTSTLEGRWRDILYAPGSGLVSPMEPGAYRSPLIVIPVDGPAVRITCLQVPAFGDTLCRLSIELIVVRDIERLGSFFDTERRGTIYALSPERSAAGAISPPPDREDWVYRGASLTSQLGSIAGVSLLRERIAAGRGEGRVGWIADRGLVLTTAAGGRSLILAEAESSEQVLFRPEIGPYRGLADPSAPVTPGATLKDLLGYGDWAEPFAVSVELVEAGGGTG